MVARWIVLLLIAAVSAPAAVTGWDGSDAFAGTQLDWCHWEPASTGGSVAQNDGLLLSTVAQPYSRAAVRTQYTLVGDFDVSVDFDMTGGFTEPINGAGASPHLNVSIGIQSESTRAIFFNRTRNLSGSGYSVYTPLAGQGGHNRLFVASSSASGSLRMTRSGALVTMRYRENASWTEFDHVDGMAEAVYVYLSAENVNASNAVSTRLTNFAILGGTTSTRRFEPTHAYRSRPDFHVGGVVADLLAHSVWGNQWGSTNPLDVMEKNGFDTAVVGVLTRSSPTLKNNAVSKWSALSWQDDFWSSVEYSKETLRRAKAEGMRLVVFFYLSDEAAYSGRQKAPPEWQGLSLQAEAAAIEQYVFEAVTDLRNSGLHPEVYEIGNEVDMGVAGFALGERIPAPPGVDVLRDLTWMKANVWDPEAVLLQAGIRGVHRADPTAKTMLHAASALGGDGNAFTLAFYRAMIANGVDFDVAGLSLPYASTTSNWNLDRYSTSCWFQRLQELFDALEAMGKPVMVREAAYPNDPSGIPGAAMQQFPYTAQGQADWLEAHLQFLSAHPDVIGFNYFYPDYSHAIANAPADLLSSGLWVSKSQAEPAMAVPKVTKANLAAAVTLSGHTANFSSTLNGPAFATSVLWSFGDGTTSTQMNPQHVYAGGGRFDWRVVVQTNVGTIDAVGTVRIGTRRHAVRH